MFKKSDTEPVNSVTRSSIPEYYSKDSAMVITQALAYDLDDEEAYRDVNHQEHYDLTGEYVENNDYVIAAATPEEIAEFIPVGGNDDETKV
jgi:hypothetical protein